MPQADILAENIDRMYAKTQYTWYPAFVELTVEDGWAYVRTTLTEADTDVAGSMCQDIAAVAFELHRADRRSRGLRISR